MTTWRYVAERTRDALECLDYPVPACLTDEPGECGATDAEHAAGNLAALRAVVEFRIAHLGPEAQPLIDDVAESIRGELAAELPCDRGHQVPR